MPLFLTLGDMEKAVVVTDIKDKATKARLPFPTRHKRK